MTAIIPDVIAVTHLALPPDSPDTATRRMVTTLRPDFKKHDPKLLSLY
jgi:hypothetical protein